MQHVSSAEWSDTASYESDGEGAAGGGVGKRRGRVFDPSDSGDEGTRTEVRGSPCPADDGCREAAENDEISLHLINEVLCAERVGQMTKTYSDIDAVTRLLEEKERDLELAARIGQSLLKKIKVLTVRNEILEEQIEHTTEEVAQLRHDLALKEELLHIYTSTADENDNDTGESTPPPMESSGCSLSIGQNVLHMDSFHRKLKELEDENFSLLSEASHLKNETLDYEEKEQQLVTDCVRELRASSAHIAQLTEELSRRSEDAVRQQEEITQLLSQIVDLQKKVKTYSAENEELSQHLGAAKDAQRQLTAEVRELQEKLAECTDMLHEAQEDAKNLRNQIAPSTTPYRWFHPLAQFPRDSLAAEIEGTMRKELRWDELGHKGHQKRVFDTVRIVNQTARRSASCCLSPLPIPGSNQTSARASRPPSGTASPRSGLYGSDFSSAALLDNRMRSLLLDVDALNHNDDRRPGQPGTPGSHDLETALHRLSLRREAYLSERRFMEEEWERRLAELASGRAGGGGGGSDRLPTPGCGSGNDADGGRLSDGARSSSASSASVDSHSSMSLAFRSYLPDKLQIVKPLEGSMTLQQWQQLAQPHLGGILDARPGVITKDSWPTLPPPSWGHPIYRMSDYEEEEPVYFPGKCVSQTNYTYTFTTCRIMHPSDVTAITTSGSGSPATRLFDSVASSPVPSRRASLAESFTNARESTRTCSASLRLPELLQERGISAASLPPPPPLAEQRQQLAAAHGMTSRPRTLPLATATPPNSPLRADLPSPLLSPLAFPPLGQPAEVFLASKPATAVLKEVMGQQRLTSNTGSQTELSANHFTLVQRLRKLGIGSSNVGVRGSGSASSGGDDGGDADSGRSRDGDGCDGAAAATSASAVAKPLAAKYVQILERLTQSFAGRLRPALAGMTDSIRGAGESKCGHHHSSGDHDSCTGREITDPDACRRVTGPEVPCSGLKRSAVRPDEVESRESKVAAVGLACALGFTDSSEPARVHLRGACGDDDRADRWNAECDLVNTKLAEKPVSRHGMKRSLSLNSAMLIGGRSPMQTSPPGLAGIMEL
ncbi:trafficking kinesin-binding protein 1-like isoform X2 [Petromyzon marinus]|uniref:Trafficking kinesin-binding protein 1-like isoform X2 n=1 Tax=Petromyzon marinus TaxID=7757 RepID=A0AAJ7WSD9_PETMA|nr:trafficking kinesin-binding protein 1-like isoform X2 [Petromyzon marinus]